MPECPPTTLNCVARAGKLARWIAPPTGKQEKQAVSSIPLPASAAIRKCRKQRGRALNQNNNRPTQGKVDIIHARIVSRVIRYMDPRVGNLSWVSHATIAKDVGIRREAIHYHLLAATLIGELRVRYHTATAAHLQISQRYPHYTEYTGGQTFTEMLGEQPGKPKRLNYYTIHKCMGCPSYHGQALPDWQIEMGAVRFATGIFMLLEVIPSARLCGSELLGGHGVGPDIADRPRR